MRWLLPLTLIACRPPGPLPGDDFGDDDDTPTPTVTGPQIVRVVTWNVEELGYPGTPEYEAVQEILARLDADIVGLNEIDEPELGHIKTMGTDLGYDTVVVPATNPFGDIRNAIMTRLPLVSSGIHKPADLSGDNEANDVTRYPVSVTVNVGQPLTVIVQHWKSGFDDGDEFRRAIDGHRTAQAISDAGDWVVAMGDVNQEIDDPPWPDVFTAIPSGMPGEFWLGSDLYNQMSAGGISNEAFASLKDLGLDIIEAQQLDGRYDTRDESGRRIDYILGSAGVRATAVAEIYDSRDDGGEGIPKAGSALPRETSASASDHFPVVAEFTVQ